MNDVQFRAATSEDAASIASLHADSWRRHYRGIYSDGFLDHDVDADRLRVWSDRLLAPDPDAFTLVAYDDDTIGFVHTILDEDSTFGALLDNLHVAHTRMGGGIGTALMARAAEFVVHARPGQPLHLWVLQQNRPAQAFYEHRHGVCVGSEASEAPGGGTIIGLRYVWPDPAVLLVP